MIKKLIKNYWEVFIIFLCSLTPILWLHAGEKVVGHDAGFRLNPSQYIFELFSTWNSSHNFGLDTSLAKGFVITQLPEIVTTSLFSSFNIGQEVSFIFWFFVIGISMYVCARGFFPDREYWIFRLYTSVFWMYNFFILQGWFITERAKFSIFAALPLAFLVARKTLTKSYSLVPAVISFGFIFFFLNGGGSPPLYGAVLLMLFITFAHTIILSALRHDWKQVWYASRVAGAFFVTVVLLSAYWILPQAYLMLRSYNSRLLSSGGIEGILSWERAVNQFASYINLVRLQGIPDWYKNPFHPYSAIYTTNPILIAASFIPFGLILFGIFRKWHQREKDGHDIWNEFSLMMILFFVGLLFTASSHAPLGFIYAFLVRTVPGFAIFRSAFYKFAPLLWFSIIVLSGYFLNMFALKWKLKRVVYASVGVLALSGVLLFHFPYFLGKQFDWNKPFRTKVEIPSYVPTMMDYLDTHTTNMDKVLLLPALDPQFHADSYSWGYWSLDVLARLYSPKTPIMANDAAAPAFILKLYDAIASDEMNEFMKFAQQSGVSKILWRNDVLYPDKITTAQNFIDSKHIVESWPIIKKEHQVGEWTLYDIENVQTSPFWCSDGVSVGGPSVENLELIDRESITKMPDDAKSLIALDTYVGDCYFCHPDALARLKNQVPLTYPRFLPDSPFYMLTDFKERYQESRVKDPALGVETQLIFATKRLVEMKEFIKRDRDDNRDELVVNAIVRYRSAMEKAVTGVEQLIGKEKNDEYGKILGTIHTHQSYINSMDDQYTRGNDVFNQLHASLNNWVKDIQQKMILSTETQKYYQISVPANDTYLLTIDSPLAPLRVQIDGKNIDMDVSDNITLSAGEHMVYLEYQAAPNLLESVTPQMNIPLPFGSEKKFSVEGLSSNETYVISYAYQVLAGNGPLFLIQQANDPVQNGWQKQRVVSQSLMDDGKWYSFEYSLSPRFGSDAIDIVFASRSPRELPSALVLGNLSVKKVVFPTVMLTAKKAGSSVGRVESVDRLNSMAYVVNLTGPCLLTSTIGFDTGWSIKNLPTTENMKNSGLGVWLKLGSYFAKPEPLRFTQISVNGFANAWYIPDEKTDRVILVYTPQLYFLLGIIISLVSALGFIIVLIVRKKKS